MLTYTNIIALILFLALMLIFFSIRFEVRVHRELDNIGCKITGDTGEKDWRYTMTGYGGRTTAKYSDEGFVGSYDGEYH